jgi:hypothetical protein
MARFSAEVAVRARRLAEPVASAERAAALPPGEPVASDAVVAPRQAAAWDVAEAPQQEVAWVGAAVLRPEAPQQEVAASAEAAEPQQVAWVGAAVLRPEAVLLRVAVLREAPDVRVAEPRAARPSAVPWVFRRGQALPWPAPQPAVRFAHAMQCLRIAWP